MFTEAEILEQEMMEAADLAAVAGNQDFQEWVDMVDEEMENQDYWDFL